MAAKKKGVTLTSRLLRTVTLIFALTTSIDNPRQIKPRPEGRGFELQHRHFVECDISSMRRWEYVVVPVVEVIISHCLSSTVTLIFTVLYKTNQTQAQAQAQRNRIPSLHPRHSSRERERERGTGDVGTTSELWDLTWVYFASATRG